MRQLTWLAGACLVACPRHVPDAASRAASGGARAEERVGVTSIAAAGSSACAVVRGGVYCWGANAGGQLGDGTTARRATAARVPGVDGAVQVTLGAGHGCATIAGGEARCWGDDGAGQLGDGVAGAVATRAVSVRGLEPVTAVSAGWAHTCALTRARAVYCWGKNHRGQLGDGTFDDRTSPVKATAIDDAVQIVAGSDRTCALRATGAIVCWGGRLPSGAPEDDFAPPPFDDVTSFALFASSTTEICAVRRGGALLCGGRIAEWSGATAVQGGSAITCALRGSEPVCWGSGSGSKEAFEVPHDAASLAVGGDFACAGRASGGVACWGGDDDGQLGDGNFGRREEPATVLGVRDAAQIAAGESATCAVRRGGDVFCWGNGAQGQLDAGAVHGARAAAVGATFACALGNDGALACWGRPPIPSLDRVVDVSARAVTVCAVRASGAVTCAKEGTPSPFDVAGVADAVRVSVGDDQACALRRSGKIACWGLPVDPREPSTDQIDHVLAQLVDVPGVADVQDFAVEGSLYVVTRDGGMLTWRAPTRSTPQVGPPVRVGGVEGVAKVSPPCVLRRDRTVACFRTTSPMQLAPVAVDGVAELSAGGAHACARRDDGSVACWGSDVLGRLGDGRTDYSRRAVDVVGLPSDTFRR